MITGVFFIFMLCLLITGIVLWATSRSASGEMACGGCGYAVRGLEALNCPECGADLRQAGIAPAGRPRRRVTGMILTFACGVVLVLSCLLTGFLFLSVSSTSVQSTTGTVRNTPLSPPPTQSDTATPPPTQEVEIEEAESERESP